MSPTKQAKAVLKLVELEAAYKAALAEEKRLDKLHYAALQASTRAFNELQSAKDALSNQ